MYVTGNDILVGTASDNIGLLTPVGELLHVEQEKNKQTALLHDFCALMFGI